jgi:hypothetical protein
MQSVLFNRGMAVVLVSMVAASLAGCSSGNHSTPIAGPSASATAEPAEAEPTEPDGSRERPYLAGTKARLADDSVWTVGFQPANTDAAAAVIAENEYNEVVEGRSMVMAEASFEVNGDTDQDLTDGANILWSLTFEYVTPGGVSYGTGTDDSCGEVPNDYFNIGTLYAGATAAGNVCVQVPTADVAGGLWSVTNGQGDKLFFATA